VGTCGKPQMRITVEFEVWRRPINTSRRLPRLPSQTGVGADPQQRPCRTSGVPQIRIFVKRGPVFDLRLAKTYVFMCVRDYVSTCRYKKVRCALSWL
jgi:hypothetical protein